MVLLKATAALTLVMGTAITVTAAPAPAAADTTFSFASWVEDVITAPETALTVDQAVEAYYNSTAGTPSSYTGEEGGPSSLLQKRATCNQLSPARVPDAVAAINYLAGLGNRACVITTGYDPQTFRTHGTARIVGLASGSAIGVVESYCNDVARAAGRVMDVCTRTDGWVQGQEINPGNYHMAVHIIRTP